MIIKAIKCEASKQSISHCHLLDNFTSKVVFKGGLVNSQARRDCDKEQLAKGRSDNVCLLLVYFQLQSGICDVLFEKAHVLFVNKGRRKRKALACTHTQHRLHIVLGWKVVLFWQVKNIMEILASHKFFIETMLCQDIVQDLFTISLHSTSRKRRRKNSFLITYSVKLQVRILIQELGLRETNCS